MQSCPLRPRVSVAAICLISCCSVSASAAEAITGAQTARGSKVAPAGLTARVYADAGTSRDSVAHTLRALQRALGPEATVLPIDAEALLHTPWEADTALIVMPGGADLPYMERLGPTGAARLRRFVEGGGRYLGLCAGGYFGADSIAFFVGDAAQAIAGERPLKFFPGRCEGPVWRDFVYHSEAGAHAARVRPDGPLAARTAPTFTLYQNGGGAFVNAELHPNTRVLLRYVDAADDQAAAVLCRAGTGHAVLTGVHPEFDAAQLPAQTPTPVREALRADASLRCETWAYLLQQLDLPARCDDPPRPAGPPLEDSCALELR